MDGLKDNWLAMLFGGAATAAGTHFSDDPVVVGSAGAAGVVVGMLLRLGPALMRALEQHQATQTRIVEQLDASRLWHRRLERTLDRQSRTLERIAARVDADWPPEGTDPGPRTPTPEAS